MTIVTGTAPIYFASGKYCFRHSDDCLKYEKAESQYKKITDKLINKLSEFLIDHLKKVDDDYTTSIARNGNNLYCDKKVVNYGKYVFIFLPRERITFGIYQGQKVAFARCHPNDWFSCLIGASIVLGRLNEQE